MLIHVSLTVTGTVVTEVVRGKFCSVNIILSRDIHFGGDTLTL